MSTAREDIADVSPEDQSVAEVAPALPIWLEIYQTHCRPRGAPECDPTQVEGARRGGEEGLVWTAPCRLPGEERT
jgi:hypothetical protein